MREDELDRVARQGTEAWKRLKKQKSWNDWLAVGAALLVGREWAMHEAGTNQPKGKGYNMEFSDWLVMYKLDDMDKGDRKRLFDVMDNLGRIEQWRGTLPLIQRLELNHPNSVWRRWKAAVAPEPDPNKKKPTLKEENIRLSEEGFSKDKRIAELEAHVVDLESAREQGGGDQPLKDKNTSEVVDTIVKTFTAKEAEEIARQVLTRLKAHGKPSQMRSGTGLDTVKAATYPFVQTDGGRSLRDGRKRT
jgi:hypothetical protein